MVQSINHFFKKSPSDQPQPQPPHPSQYEGSDQKIRPLKIQKNKISLSLKSSTKKIDSPDIGNLEPDTGRSIGSEYVNTPKFPNPISMDDFFPLTNLENCSEELKVSSSLKKQIYFSKKSELSMAEDYMDASEDRINRDTVFEILSGGKSGIEESNFSVG